MNPGFKCMFALCVLAGLAACATSDYIRKTQWTTEGYTDQMIGDGVYRVSYVVDDKSPPEKALRYWHQHASELCDGAVDYQHDEKQSKQNHPAFNPETNRFEDHYFSYVEGTVKCRRD